MSAWIPVSSSALPSGAGWYPILSDWRTASLHPGAKFWQGSKWAGGCADRIVGFSLERFDCPHSATSRAFDLDVSVVDPANANVAQADTSLERIAS